MGKYIQDGELTPDALLTTELIKQCKFGVGDVVPVRINDDERGQSRIGPKRQYYQRFVDVTYPDGDRSASMIIPDCVMHHQVSNYYGRNSIYVGVPQSFVKDMEVKLSTSGHSPLFQDKKILSDTKYWWTRSSKTDAKENEEFIRILDDDGEEFFASFMDFFAEYPSSALANVTCTLKLMADTPEGQELKGNETWRASIAVSMFTPFDKIDVPAPSTGILQKSAAGPKDKIKAGLLSIRRKGPASPASSRT